MTAVLDVVDCPQCDWRAFSEFQTRTLTTSIFCPRCGYQENTRPITKVTAVKRKGKVGDPTFRTTRRAGHGAYMLKGLRGASEIGALHRSLTRSAITRFKKSLQHPGIDAKRSYLSRWNPKRRRVEMVVGRYPRNLP